MARGFIPVGLKQPQILYSARDGERFALERGGATFR